MGYLGNGLTITGTQNSKRIVVDATPNQTISTVTGGYLTGQLDVYRNGVKLVDTQDYTASDGASVTFLNAVSEGDELEFVVFENFDVANALSKSGGSLNGDLVVTGIATFNSDVSIGGTLTYEDVTNIDSVGLITARSGVEIGTPGIAATLTAAGGAVFTGVVTATSFTGDGTGLTGVASTDNIITGTAATFNSTVSIANSIFHVGDTNTAFGFPANDTFTVRTAGSERLTVGVGGTITIGDSSFGDSLGQLRIINDASSSPASLALFGHNNTTTGDPFGQIQFAEQESGTGGQIKAKIEAQAVSTNERGSDLVFFTAANSASSVATERFRITSGGLVGIGTINPNRDLEVVKDGNAFIRAKNTSSSVNIDILASSSAAFVGPQSNHDLGLQTNNAERLRITSGGRVLIGTTSSRGGNFNNSSGVDAQFQLEGTSFITAFANIVRNSNDENPAGFAIGKSRGTSAGSNVVLQNNDIIGEFAFQGSDGSKMVAAADIECQIDGTPGSSDMPGRLIFSTNAGGTGTTERLRIASSGQIGLGGANYGTAGQVITSNGSGSAPTWQDVSGGITTHVGTASGIVTSVFLNDATDHKVTVTGFVTFTATQAGTEGQSHTIRIVNSGIATVGFSTYFLFPSGSAPVLPIADGAVSLISFTVHDSVGAGCTQLLAGASLNFS